ncbi:MAG TPA: CPBP family intramembrane glutamic endopeptidase [Thermoanaerobaculia bacterium]
MPSESWLRKIRWPMAGLGLGTPANLASLSPAQRPRLGRTILASVVIGLAMVLVVLGLDDLLFSGESLGRIRAIGAMPWTLRLGVAAFSSISEELIYRLGLSTLVAGLAFLALRGRSRRAAQISTWLGIVVASVLFGLAHVGNAPNSAHPVLRALTLNGLAALVLGWLYWYRGLEAAVVTHFIADATLYLAIASLF